MPIKRTRDYAIVDRKLLTDTRMSLKDRGMLLTLLCLPDCCSFSAENLCNILSDDQTVVVSVLNKLEELHYLKRNELKNENGNIIDTEWVVYDEPYSI